LGHLGLYRDTFTFNIWDYVKHGEERNVRRGVGILEEREHLEDPGIDARLIRKWVFK
jgi:outer membrane protein assembly factor BamE (lipoprotein component of BamABCDE complex)